jgi:hypothetical protein
MSSGPATTALSYALLIACASMPLLLPVSYFAVKLHDNKRRFKNKSDTEEDGVEMEMRDAYGESRGKRGKRAAYEQIGTIPRQLHASQAADAAELSKARIVQVVAYCRRAGPARMGGCAPASSGVCACTCPGVSGAKGVPRTGTPVRFVIAAKRLLWQDTAPGPSCQGEDGPVAKPHDRWHSACCWLTGALPHAVCCMPATSLKWVSRRSSAVSEPSRKRSGQRKPACMAIVPTRKPASVNTA